MTESRLDAVKAVGWVIILAFCAAFWYGLYWLGLRVGLLVGGCLR
jgi:hypothetical protein